MVVVVIVPRVNYRIGVLPITIPAHHLYGYGQQDFSFSNYYFGGVEGWFRVYVRPGANRHFTPHTTHPPRG